jgi:Putative cyclase
MGTAAVKQVPAAIHHAAVYGSDDEFLAMAAPAASGPACDRAAPIASGGPDLGWQPRGHEEAGIAALFVASLGLLMTDSVELSNVEIFDEPHKGTRGGPSDRAHGPAAAGGRLVELSHVIKAGMITYPGLPGPEISPYMTREASRERYAPGTEFAIDRLTMVGNTGTYLDAPYHRYRDRADLSALTLAQTADLPAVVVRVTGARQPGIDVGALAALDVRGRAVLLHTGDDARSPGCPGSRAGGQRAGLAAGWPRNRLRLGYVACRTGRMIAEGCAGSW